MEVFDKWGNKEMKNMKKKVGNKYMEIWKQEEKEK